MTEFAIVGLGSWGLSVLERTVSQARRTTDRLRVHVVQPGEIGGGVYALDQPDYLVLNNACGQLSLYASPDPEDRPAYGVGLHEWAVSQGFRWVGWECRKDPGGREIRETDYLPRRVMGEYLAWFYAELTAAAPENLEIVRHRAAAVDIVVEARGRECVVLDDGTALHVDHVILTSGHTWNDEPGTETGVVRYQRPYPVDYFTEIAPPGAPIAVAGMGLVGYDMITALTTGRGGTFTDDGGRLTYQRSGREPVVYLYSRSGMPYCAKSAHGVDPTGVYQPIVCTADVFRAITGAGVVRPRRRVDFRNDLLPLLYAEMQARYFTHAALLAGGDEASSEVGARLRAGWLDGRFDQVVADLEPTYGAFVPAEHLFAGAGRHFASSREYETFVYDMVETDLEEAMAPLGSPAKAAEEVMRILRDQLRSVIEFGGLALDSYVDFQSNIKGRINRLEAGPPPLRSQQLLALLDAGVVRIPFGPAPAVSPAADGRVVIRSTQLDRPYAATVNAVIRGHLDLPSVARSASPLLSKLYSTGRLTQLSYGETSVGSVAINETFHPFDSEGRVQDRLTLLGVLTEGVRYFTHYLPSPKSRLRAILDAQHCVEGIIAAGRARTAAA